MLYQSAYAATLGQQPGYPGSTALPNIGNGPTLGCTPTNTTKATWVSNFNPLSTVTFAVDGAAAGTSQVLSNGSVLVVMSFTSGHVSVNGNAPVPTRVGTNDLVVKGHKTTSTGTYVVGLRMAFTVPHGDARSCVTTPVTTSSTTITTSTGVTSTSTTIVRPHHNQIFTTTTRPMPTTLAKAIESPLQISPNKVILEASLLAAVLAAVLSAGALGSIWAASERGGAGGAGDGGSGEGGAGDEGGAGEGAEGGSGGAPAPGPAPSPGGGAASSGAGSPTVSRATSAFARPAQGPAPAGGGGS